MNDEKILAKLNAIIRLYDASVQRGRYWLIINDLKELRSMYKEKEESK